MADGILTRDTRQKWPESTNRVSGEPGAVQVSDTCLSSGFAKLPDSESSGWNHGLGVGVRSVSTFIRSGPERGVTLRRKSAARAHQFGFKQGHSIRRTNTLRIEILLQTLGPGKM